MTLAQKPGRGDNGVVERRTGRFTKHPREGVQVWEDEVQEEYWEDDLYQYNLAEADDYRNEDSDWESYDDGE